MAVLTVGEPFDDETAGDDSVDDVITEDDSVDDVITGNDSVDVVSVDLVVTVLSSVSKSTKI